MAKYRNNSAVVDAIQWVGQNSHEIIDFCGLANYYFPKDGEVYISTLEGDHMIKINDYIIKDGKGKLYSCRPGIFESTHEKIESGEVDGE